METFIYRKPTTPTGMRIFQGRGKPQGGQSPPRGSEMTSHCVLNVPSEKEGWLVEKLFIYGEIKCKRGTNNTFHSFDHNPSGLQMTPFGEKIERFANIHKRCGKEECS